MCEGKSVRLQRFTRRAQVAVPSSWRGFVGAPIRLRRLPVLGLLCLLVCGLSGPRVLPPVARSFYVTGAAIDRSWSPQQLQCNRLGASRPPYFSFLESSLAAMWPFVWWDISSRPWSLLVMFCLEKLDLDTRLQLEQSSAPYVISITLSGIECRCNTNEFTKKMMIYCNISPFTITRKVLVDRSLKLRSSPCSCHGSTLTRRSPTFAHPSGDQHHHHRSFMIFWWQDNNKEDKGDLNCYKMTKCKIFQGWHWCDLQHHGLQAQCNKDDCTPHAYLW